jgi:hypothetical protein
VCAGAVWRVTGLCCMPVHTLGCIQGTASFALIPPSVRACCDSVLFVLHAPPAGSERDGRHVCCSLRRGDEILCVGMEMPRLDIVLFFPTDLQSNGRGNSDSLSTPSQLAST